MDGCSPKYAKVLTHPDIEVAEFKLLYLVEYLEYLE